MQAEEIKCTRGHVQTANNSGIGYDGKRTCHVCRTNKKKFFRDKRAGGGRKHITGLGR